MTESPLYSAAAPTEAGDNPPRRMRRRLMLLVGLGVVLSLGMVGYTRWWLARPIGSGPAGPSVAREAFKRTWSERPVLLLGIGDSVTAGLGADRRDHSYFERVRINPADEFGELRGISLSAVLPNLTADNRAVSGTTSLEHLRVIERLEPFDSDLFGIVVMTTGGNDLIHNYGRTSPREGAMYGATLAQAEPWIVNFEMRLNRMLDLLTKRFPGGSAIFLADIYDPTDGVGDAPSVFLPDWPDGLAIHARYNEVLHRAAEERANAYAVPMHAAFLGHGSHCQQFWRSTYRADDPHYWYFENIEDPNDRGYDAIRRVFLNAMVEAKLETHLQSLR